MREGKKEKKKRVLQGVKPGRKATEYPLGSTHIQRSEKVVQRARSFSGQKNVGVGEKEHKTEPITKGRKRGVAKGETEGEKRWGFLT